MAHMMKKCDASGTSFFGIIPSKLHFSKKSWYSVVGRSLLRKNDPLSFWSFCWKY